MQSMIQPKGQTELQVSGPYWGGGVLVMMPILYDRIILNDNIPIGERQWVFRFIFPSLNRLCRWFVIVACRRIYRILISSKLHWLYLTVWKTNAVNFNIDKYAKVLPFKSTGNYWQKISEYDKILCVIHTKNARMDIHSVHWWRTW